MAPLLLILLLLNGPSLRVYASPRISIAVPGEGSVVTVHARIDGVVDEKWYCPTVTFIFPDTTKSERKSDCPPFEDGEEGDTHWEATRRYPPGEWNVEVILSKNSKPFARQTAKVYVQ